MLEMGTLSCLAGMEFPRERIPICFPTSADLAVVPGRQLGQSGKCLGRFPIQEPFSDLPETVGVVRTLMSGGSRSETHVLGAWPKT